MANRPSRPYPDSLRILFSDGTLTGLGDRQLLEHFLASGEPTAEAAFATLVRRHGPMVMRVCQQWLGDHHAAEDAFQATFLVLARRAHRLRQPDLLAPWLYEVARRTARKAHTINRLQRRRQRLFPAAGPDEPIGDVGRHERPMIGREEADLLYEELGRLPEKYRAPVILCHLEGLTHEEAARRLGCPAGTLSARLIRARALLRSRLTRRGVAPTVGLPVGLAAERASAAMIPRALIASTSGSVMRMTAAGAAVREAPAGRLAEAVLQSLGLARLRGAAALLVAIVAGVAIGAAATLQLAPGDHSKPGLSTLATWFGFSLTRPRPPQDVARAGKTADGPKPAPGYFWVWPGPIPFEWPPRGLVHPKSHWENVFRNPAAPGDPKQAEVVCYVVEVEDGSLLVTLLHPAGLEGEPVLDYRPVVFDARGRRYLPEWDHGAPRAKPFGARMPIDHYRLSPDMLEATAVVSLGIERMTGSTLLLAQRDAGAAEQGHLPTQVPGVADGDGFQTTPGWSWQIAPFPIARQGTTRSFGDEICCDVVKTRDGSLVIYLAVRRDGGVLPGDQYQPALFDARRCRLRYGMGWQESVSSLRDDPSSTKIATGARLIVNTLDDRDAAKTSRPAAEIAFVGLERTDPAVPERPQGAAPSASDPAASLRRDRSASRPSRSIPTVENLIRN
jgi:RNA polymerase sigma factor (sigma-70 family)